MLTYALNKSFMEMDLAIKAATHNLNSDELKKDVNYRVGTFLHWLLDTYEYLQSIGENPLSQNEKAFFSGLRYANNKLKHDVNVIQLYERKGGFSFPMHFPFASEIITFRWTEIEEGENSQWKKQRKKYQDHLSHEEIIPTAEKALSLLKKFKSSCVSSKS